MCNGKYEELAKLVKKCKTNREKIPEELLQTKYRKSFFKLKGDIKKPGKRYSRNCCCHHLQG